MQWEKVSVGPITEPAKRAILRSYLETLDHIATSESGEDIDRSIGKTKTAFLKKVENGRRAEDKLWLRAVLSTLADLAGQRWRLKYERSHIYILRPADQEGRSGLRERLVARRNQQLAEPSVQKFVKGMEMLRMTLGKRRSIFSLMCDGRNLAKRLVELESGNDDAVPLVQPYLQVANADAVCEHTGLRLIDIWRYFRHTWSNPYESIPGRSMLLLVRDRAWPNHPVIGIAALSSAAVRLSARDEFIGWDTDDVIREVVANPSDDFADWVLKTLQNALQDIYMADFVRDGLIAANPLSDISEEVLAGLRAVSSQQKDAHHRLMDGGDYKTSKQEKSATDDDWELEAQKPLFRAKRAAELATIFELWGQVEIAYRGKIGAERIIGLVSTSDGRAVLGKVVRIARSKTVGTAIADLTVCGAIAPYNHLAGGKLVAMLATSPEVVLAYRERYGKADSVIASSMAGRRVNRAADLVYVGTSSLYGKRPNQYDRISYPCNLVGGADRGAIRYHFIRGEFAEGDGNGATKGVGSFHFSPPTLRALEEFCVAEKGGWRVNNVFGEGTSPKIRAIREGVGAIGFDAGKLLTHGMGKCLYGVPLIKNLRNYLLGLEVVPQYLYDLTNHTASSQEIAAQWSQRWAIGRGRREDVLMKIRMETLIYPVKHHARVVLPSRSSEQMELVL